MNRARDQQLADGIYGLKILQYTQESRVMGLDKEEFKRNTSRSIVFKSIFSYKDNEKIQESFVKVGSAMSCLKC